MTKGSDLLVAALVNEGVGVALIPGSHFNTAGPPVSTVGLIPELLWQYSLATRRRPSHNPAADAFIAIMKTAFQTHAISKGEQVCADSMVRS